MTHAELIAISALVLLTLLFILLIVGVHHNTLFVLLISGILAIAIYYILLMTGAISCSRLHAVGVGATGLLYLISLIFM